MRVSLKWLADYVDLDLSPEEIGHRLTMAGLEMEHVHRVGGDWDPELITVGEVQSVDPHPNADRLRLATVNYGGAEPQTVVCGAPNVAPGQKVVFARAGATLVDGHSGKAMVLRPAKIRGVESAGMVCSERELGLSDGHEGILVLEPDAPVGRPLAQYLGDAILDLDVTPNRPDWLSMLGVAREVAALTGNEVREPEHTYEDVDEMAPANVSVDIAASDLCFRYVASVIDGVTLGSSPAWMQERLNASGMRPINNVVDITNYVMLELGQPLHAFDFAAVKSAKIIVRRARAGEHLTTLDGAKRELTPEMLVIANENDAMALAGVMGGEDSEVTENTKTILLESATFHAPNVRRTAATLKLRSEASSRFEKGLSPELAMIASQRATKMLVEIAGGRALHGLVDCYAAPAKEVRVDVTRRRLQQVLGIDLPTSDVRNALTLLGFHVKWEPPEHYRIRVPYWRTDISIADDLAEEVARVVGYDQIPTKNLGGDVPPAEPQPLRELRERLRDALAAAGMQEVITYSLTTRESLVPVVSDGDLDGFLHVVNPLSAEHEYLRPTLRGSVLQALAQNQHQRESEIALFEAARTYVPREGELPEEREQVVGVVSGRRENRWGRASDDPVDFFDAKGYVVAALRTVGVEPEFATAESLGLLSGRTATISADGVQVGVVGEVHPDVRAAYDLDDDAFLFEVSVDELLPAVKQGVAYEPLPRYPPVVQDIAVIVDADRLVGDVQSVIEQNGLVRAVELFDVYEGEGVPASKKSLAFSITYQSSDKTLTDREVAVAQEAILKGLKTKLGAELRG